MKWWRLDGDTRWVVELILGRLLLYIYPDQASDEQNGCKGRNLRDARDALPLLTSTVRRFHPASGLCAFLSEWKLVYNPLSVDDPMKDSNSK
jgi:hypothetical protein